MRKSQLRKEDIGEDYCFSCKDGGHLLICDFKNCLKAYHPQCVGKDSSFLESTERWTCGWHSCFLCKKASTFQCYCCPRSLCHSCIKDAEFVQVKKRTKGFCNDCLKLAILIEQNIDVDSDGGKVDFGDTETYEFLFKDYWEIVKEQEGLTLVDLQAANALLKRGENFKGGSDSDRPVEEDVGSEFDELEDNYDDGLSFFTDLKGKRGRPKKSVKRSRSKKKEFIGWGSAELINFLTSIGEHTEKPLMQVDACEIVKNYVQANNLYDPETKKKKKVICDERLYALFRKKKVKFYKIYSLLESHIAANNESDDEFSFSSEEVDDSFGRQQKRKTASDSKFRNSLPKNFKEDISAPPKSHYASIVGKNINAVYLKRTLIMELLKCPDSFEEKVIGCFVRVKVDPKDFYFIPEKIYKLGQVTGIKKALETYKIGETSTDVVLRVSSIYNDVPISMLSDDDFEEDECEDIRQLANRGLFKRPTVAELEEKIISVHADIMNHWIDKEILKLQKLIDRANEKGWRRELFDYIDKREKLRTSEERKRLLQEIPPVIADICQIEANTNSQLNSSAEKKENGAAVHVKAAEVIPENGVGFHKNIDEGALAGLCHDTEDSPQASKDGDDADVDLLGKDAAEHKPLEGTTETNATSNTEVIENEDGAVPNSKITIKIQSTTEINATSSCQVIENEEDEAVPNSKMTNKIQSTTEINVSSRCQVIENGEVGAVPNSKITSEIQIIDLFEDDDRIWHYVDPSGNEQGPFDMVSLSYWMKEGFFDEDFKVWRTGQSREDAILLTDALRLCQ